MRTLGNAAFALLLGLLVLLGGCGDKKNSSHYSSTGVFSLGTPACNGGDVCAGAR